MGVEDTQRHDLSLVRRSKRNGLKHRRREEAQRGADRKARKISQGSEAERLGGQRATGRATRKGAVYKRGVRGCVNHGLGWPARPWALPARRSARGSGRLPRDPANCSLAARPEAWSASGGGGPGRGLARHSDGRSPLRWALSGLT